MSQEFRLKNIDETINYFLEEIKQNELISEKHKKVQHLASIITVYISIFVSASLIGIPIGIKWNMWLKKVEYYKT